MASFYTRTIAEALPGLNPQQYAAIEDVMRHDIFHSTLDWQTSDQLKQGAREAYDLLVAIEEMR